jgi:hypothetical protein
MSPPARAFEIRGRGAEVWRELRSAGPTGLDDRTELGQRARELHSLVFGGRRPGPLPQALLLDDLRRVVFAPTPAGVEVRAESGLEGSDRSGREIVDLGDPLDGARAAIERLRGIAV